MSAQPTERHQPGAHLGFKVRNSLVNLHGEIYRRRKGVLFRPHHFCRCRYIVTMSRVHSPGSRQRSARRSRVADPSSHSLCGSCGRECGGEPHTILRTPGPAAGTSWALLSVSGARGRSRGSVSAHRLQRPAASQNVPHLLPTIRAEMMGLWLRLQGPAGVEVQAGATQGSRAGDTSRGPACTGQAAPSAPGAAGAHLRDLLSLAGSEASVGLSCWRGARSSRREAAGRLCGAGSWRSPCGWRFTAPGAFRAPCSPGGRGGSRCAEPDSQREHLPLFRAHKPAGLRPRLPL